MLLPAGSIHLMSNRGLGPVNLVRSMNPLRASMGAAPT